MTLRSRITLTYAVIFGACLLVMAVTMYYEFVIEFPHLQQTEGYSMTSEVLEVLGIGVPAIVCGIIGGWFLVRRSLAPIERLTKAAERLHEGNLHEVLPRTNNGDEIDRLTEVLNEFTARLGTSVEQMREFTFHASHELKTPLTVMRGELEAALRSGFSKASPEALIASQLEEVGRLARIVESLTLLAKADARLLKLAKAPVALDALVRGAVEDAEILTEVHAVRIAECTPCQVAGDKDRLRQLLLNLTDNAIKYNHPAGGTLTYSLTYSLTASDGEAHLVISNTGPGLEREQCLRAFERFYRGDASHASTVEGSGLGLSICQWIVLAHGGRISIASVPGEKTEVAIALPLLRE